MKIIKIAILMIATVFSFTVYAQPGVAVGSATGQDGTSVTIPIIFTGDGVAIGVQMDINYDNAILTPDLSNCGTAGGSAVNSTVSCQISVVGPNNVVRILGFSIPSAVSANGTLGDISFAIAGGTAPQVLPITVTGEAYSGSAPDGSSTAGQITVTAGPVPAYTSNPVTTSTLTFATVLQGGTADTQNVDITNTGDAGTTLTGTCALNGADAGSYTINSGSAYSVAQGAAANTVVVQCNTTAAGTFNAATLDCTSASGGNGTYPLNCTVSTPMPAYASTPAANSAIAFGSAIAGTGDLTQSLNITNIGDAGTTLTTACSISGADAARFSVAGALSGGIMPGAGATGDVTCLDGADGVLTASLDCTHDGGAAGAADPVSYALSCTYTPPGQAQYASTPADGATIEMTTGTGVLAGSASPTTSIAITNPAPNGTDNALNLEACTYAGNPEISVTSADPLTASLAPVSAATETVAFSCNTTTAGNFTGTYSCPYSTDGAAGPEGTATYTVNCDVRAAESAGNPAGGSSSNASITAPPGGSTTSTVVTFSESNNEGVDITDLSCTIPAGDFTVVTVVPATIPAGGSIGVDVSFTDPAVAGPYTDVMTCTYTDSAGAQSVTVNLTGAVQAIIVPTLSTMGYVAMMFGLLLVGFFGFRRRA